MKGPLEYDDFGLRDPFLITVAPRQFDRGFVGLGTGITEKHVFHAGGLTEHFSNRFLQADLKQVRGVYQSRRLLGDRGSYARVVVAEVGHCDARDTIEIAQSVCVVQQCAFPMGEGHGQPSIGRHDGAFEVWHGQGRYGGSKVAKISEAPC